MVDASITHLLRTCLSKSTKDQAVNPSPLTLMKDSQKIKKHIALLCDRLGKGAKLQTEGTQPVIGWSSCVFILCLHTANYTDTNKTWR